MALFKIYVVVTYLHYFGIIQFLLDSVLKDNLSVCSLELPSQPTLPNPSPYSWTETGMSPSEERQN